MHAPFGREEGGKEGSDRDGNSRTITAKDECIIRYSSLIFMIFLVHMMTRYSQSMRVQPTVGWYSHTNT